MGKARRRLESLGSQAKDTMKSDEERLQRTPLYQAHLASGGRMVPFGGWEMPVQYTGITEEHQLVRSSVGMFDVSHMGQIAISGKDSLALLHYLCPGDPGLLCPGKIMYGVFCNDGGGVVDDLLVYCLAKDEYLLVVNASRIEQDFAWIRNAAANFAEVSIENLSGAKGMIALQGPLAEALLADLAEEDIAALQYYWSIKLSLDGCEVILSRSGYTGEDGFEIICAADATERLWATLKRLGARPCGLGARDTLRTEMGYCLYGHELGAEISPLEAGLSWTMALEKEADFIGRDALLRQRQEGTYRRLVGFKLQEKGIPRPDCKVHDDQDRLIGIVSSGTFSPGLQKGIGLAFVEPEFRKKGTELQIDIRTKGRRAQVVRLPFVKSRVKRGKK